MSTLLVRPSVFASVFVVATLLPPSNGASDAAKVRVPMKPEEAAGYRGNPTKPFGPLLQEFTTVDVQAASADRCTLQVGPAGTGPTFRDVDLRWFVPRVPALAKNDPTLVRVALTQREFNRNETKFGLIGDFAETKLANNCLRSGLWEVVLEQKKDDGSTGMKYHGWFTFPRDPYALSFEKATGIPYADYEKQLAAYPAMGGFKFPLEKLRVVDRERAVTGLDAHLADAIESLPEQKRKAHLVVTPELKTYGDFVDPKRQPVKTAKFSEPGFYDLENLCSFDLAWLAKPQSVAWRKVHGVSDPVAMDELEIRYANGRRLLIGDAGIAALVAAAKKPEKDTDVLRITFGICTPEIYATAAERKAEFDSPRANYLVLLDADGNHLDNHTTGVDRVFLWRSAGQGGKPDELHVYLVGYERITTVSHLSFPFAKE